MDCVEYCVLIGDVVCFCQVFNNLLLNVVKFIYWGQINVQFDQWELGDECIEIWIDVEDSGIGIFQNKQVCIFDVFSQVDMLIK